MRILFVSHYALPHLGGVEIVVDALARELTKRGHAVTHVATSAAREGEAREHATPYAVQRVPAWNGLERIGFPLPLVGPKAIAVLKQLIAQADVVHAHGMLFPPSTLALRLAKKAGHRCRILTDHSGPFPQKPSPVERVEQLAHATLGHLTARAAQAIILINDAIEPAMRRLAPHARIVAIANGVDLDRYRPPRPGERERLREKLGWDDRPRLLYVGRVMRRKGVHHALAAAALADENEFELIVAGPGEAAPQRNTRMLGALAPEQVAELYRAADALVLPSVREGFPVTVQEALASGLPVIVSDPTVAKRVGDACTYVDAEPRKILDAVRQTFGRKAHFDRDQLSWSRAADQHLALYADILARRS